MQGSLITKALSVEMPSAIQNLIKTSSLIDFGVIQKVQGKGVVSVAVSVAESKGDVRYITCTLVSLNSQSIAVDVIPKVGDKVIVFYPRKYDVKMFRKESKDVLLNPKARGYNMMCGLALLCNQFKTDTHNNSLTLDDGTVELKLAYSEDDSKNKVIASINKDGELSYTSNENITLTLNKDGELSYTSNENITLTLNKEGELSFNSNDKVKLDVKKSGESTLVVNNTTISINDSDVITINNGKAEVKIDSSGAVTIDAKTGKVSVKNNTTDLKAVIDGLAQALESLTTVGSPATQATSPATLTTINTWRTGKLNALM